MVSPTAMAGFNELVGAAALSFVAVVIAFPLLSTAIWPVTEALTNGGAGVPATSGLFPMKSPGLRPPAAVIVPGRADALAPVTGVVGRFAEYVTVVVACAGTKLFWNCRTCGTFPRGLPVFGST